MEKIKPQLKKVNKNEVVLRHEKEWLHFTKPHMIIRAETVQDVLPALDKIEHLTQRDGWYAAGFLSYESGSAFESVLPTQNETGFPYLWFGIYPQPQSIVLPKSENVNEILDWQPTICRESYNAAISAVKAHIAEGRTYQVNYTMRLQTDFTIDPWNFFLNLSRDQNKHAAYIDMGRYAICSASPELFFQLHGERIICKPMKGTVGRGRTTTEDRERAEWLRNSAKNRAENVMIVDMVRNDLGRIAKIGSVNVSSLFEAERYPTLWQMTSTVHAETTVSLTKIFSALFPCASITGAPKVSTMKIIADLETTPRKVYTGTIGWIGPDRKAKFNVAIRTLLVDRNEKKAEYGVGGGVVWDSTSQDEYAEAWLKARVLTKQEPVFSLLETILWTPDGGFSLRDKHITRMSDSASYFDIPIAQEELNGYLDMISSGFSSPQRVRVLLDQEGTLTFESVPIELSQKTEPIHASLSKAPVDSSNVFLFHKTTHRQVYRDAFKGSEGVDDVLLYNERGELTEFTIGNLVVKLNGKLLTPPISCGVLAGTFRAHLLETDQILEKTISLQDLARCEDIFRINSIRHWQRIELR